MTKKKQETFYVIDEEDDSLEVVFADSAEAVVQELYQVDQNMEPFYVTIFNAKDAQRFEISADVTVTTSYRKVK